MDQGVSDPFIVVVKLRTDENVVTYWRRKFPVNNRKDEGEGMDMLTRKKKKKLKQLETTIMRSETRKGLKEETPRKAHRIERETNEIIVQTK